MPRSFPYKNYWRLVLVALIFIAPLLLAGLRTGAEASSQAQAKKTLTRLNTSETPEGSNITITSDSPLNDYSAYRSGDRFYVLIPAADASRVANGLRGRGFADVRAQKRGNDVLLSFRLLQGATARVSQKFNRLEILITVPALVAGNSQKNTNNQTNSTGVVNPNIRTPQNNTTGTGNTGSTGSTGTTNPSPRTGGGSSRFNTGGANSGGASNSGASNSSETSTGSTGSSSANPIAVTPPNNGGQQNPIATNPNLNSQTPGIPATPNGTVTQSGTEGFPPVNGANPLASPGASVPSDQVAQTIPPTPINPATTNPQSGVTTNAPAPASDSSFGATLKQNWIFVVLALVVAGLLGWFILARSRTESPVERRIESLREAKTETLRAEPVREAAAAKPVVVAAPVVTPAPKVEAEPLVEPEAEPAELESEPAALESGPAASIAAPLAAELVSSPVVEEEEEAEPVEEVEEESAHAGELELEPLPPVVPVMPVAPEPIVPEPVAAAPVAAEQAGDEVAGLLAGHSYDEAVINTQDEGARQMVAAELLAALAGRNTVRHERARDAFIKFGYFDDATRTLRTAESPAERASAARSLGLVRDQSATPHLVAALEDDSPEVRRAAVESLAEVRDPSAVAALESLRDREKDRRVPTALIQHAIEASVVGRMRVEPTQPVASPYATTPLTEPQAPATTPLPADFVVEPPAQEEAVAVVEEAAAEPQVVEAEEPALEAPAAEMLETPALEAAPAETAPVESEAVIAPLIPEEVAPEVEVETPAPVAL
ncbi:MAG: HEAT repeat domain-containing protein, partial [Acidobacteria bacterium]|nr:HEAT repeat domain-containing protein [Acidobacteriota bacterium]